MGSKYEEASKESLEEFGKKASARAKQTPTKKKSELPLVDQYEIDRKMGRFSGTFKEYVDFKKEKTFKTGGVMKKGYAAGGAAKKKMMAAGGMPMVMKDGKKVPAFAADGKGKMAKGGMTKAKMAVGGGVTKSKMMASGGMSKKAK